jgi:NAD/NADP transhydrogenase alpha subunit
MDVIVKVRGPDQPDLGRLEDGQTLISVFWPAQNPELLEAAADQQFRPFGLHGLLHPRGHGPDHRAKRFPSR